MSLLFNMLSRLVITFLPRSKHLLISWLQLPSAVIWEPQKIKSDTVSTVLGHCNCYTLKWNTFTFTVKARCVLPKSGAPHFYSRRHPLLSVHMTFLLSISGLVWMDTFLPSWIGWQWNRWNYKQRAYLVCAKILGRDFLDGLVAKILSSQCREPRFNSWSGN